MRDWKKVNNLVKCGSIFVDLSFLNRHGKERRGWLKLHVAVDTKSKRLVGLKSHLTLHL